MGSRFYQEASDSDVGVFGQIKRLFDNSNCLQNICFFVYILSLIIQIAFLICYCFNATGRDNVGILICSVLQIIFAYLYRESRWTGKGRKQKKQNDLWIDYWERINRIETILVNRGLYDKKIINCIIQEIEAEIIRFTETKRSYLAPAGVLIEKIALPAMAFSCGLFFNHVSISSYANLYGTLISFIIAACLVFYGVSILVKELEIDLFINPRRHLINSLREIVQLRFN